MRVLFSTGSAARYMMPPQLGDEQVHCGPDWSNDMAPDGRVRSLATPVGAYDLAAVAAKLPAAQRPDLVICLVDATWRNRPGNLGAFKCPCVLLVADTHHLRSPILGMLGYAMSEPFTRIVFLYDRHHAACFRSAGLRNLFWFPGLTFPHADAAVQAARAARRETRLAFVGQAGALHPRRKRLLARLAAHGVPVVTRALPQAEALGFYGASLAGFNASLNGDLNLRVFETLAAGAALLTDRLAPAAGLEKLFTDGRELLTYGSPEELAENAAHLLAHPAEAAALGAAGQRWFDENFSAARRRELFEALVFDGSAPAGFAFSPGETGRVLFPGATPSLIRTLQVYEKVQELHRTQETVRVALPPSLPADVGEVFATLPRLELAEPADAGDVDLAALGEGDTELPAAATTRLWCWPNGDEWTARLAAEGFVSSDASVGLFRRPLPRRDDPRPHVLVYTDDPESGGVAQYNHNLLLALAREGCRVSCAQSFSAGPLIAEQSAAGIAHRWIDYHTGREFARTVSDGTAPEDIFCADRPDLVLFSDCCPVSNMAAREIALRHGIPFVVVIGFVGAYLAKQFAAQLPALARQHAAAAAVVAVSEDNRRLLERLFGTPADRLRVIHYGRPTRFFAPVDPATRARLRAERNIPADAVVCLTTARLSSVKGFAHQLRAMRKLEKTDAWPRLHFVWAGDGDERAALEREIARCGWQQRVHLLGHRWDVADWYDAADIFVLPSHIEGMPLSIMEAMAKGLPVVASAVSGIPEELGDTGRLLPDPAVSPERTSAELGRTLLEWTRNPDTRRAIGARGRERALQCFREERMIAEMLALVRQHTPSASPTAEQLLATATT